MAGAGTELGDAGSLGRPLRWALVLALVAAVVWVRLLPLALAGLDPASQALYRYHAADGREHVYLGDLDSYVWVRNARNYLRTGTTCDAVVDGQCRDRLTDAPVGAVMRYARSLHIVAIVGLARLIAPFAPGYPLSATAFLVPVIVGALAVLPAFGIGRRLGGDLAGIASAAAVALNPYFFARTAGSDNDVWHVVLPLVLVWAIVRGLDAPTRRARAGWAVAAGAFVGLHAATWRGWVFVYLSVLAALTGYTGLLALRALAGRWSSPRAEHPPARGAHTGRATALASRSVGVAVEEEKEREALQGEAGPWSAVGRTAQVTLVFYLAAAGCVTLAGAGDSYLRAPLAALAHVGAAGGGAGGAPRWAESPDALETVAELLRPARRDLALAFGGKPLLLLGLLGLPLLMLPARAWRWRHLAVLAGGAVVYGWALYGPDRDAAARFALIALPAAAALLVLAVDPGAGGPGVGGRLVVAVWLLAAYQQAWQGARYVLLLVAPFGIATGYALGRAHALVARLGARGDLGSARAATGPAPPAPRARRGRGLARPAAPLRGRVLAALVLLAVLLPAARLTYGLARDYRPRMHDAWWDTLEGLRDGTPPDAIVDLWWDYGYWAKYVAERRVSADGGSLLTRIPLWLGRALLAGSERESLGILRMLNCGSAATPQPEGRAGAYGKLLARGLDAIAADGLVGRLVAFDRAAARARLAAAGLDPPVQDDVLASTHCTPPASYLVLSSEQAQRRSWVQLARWQPRRAAAVARARSLPAGAAVAELTGRLGYDESQARALVAAAQALGSAAAVERFVASPAGLLTPRWVACVVADAATWRCPLVAADRRMTALESVTVDPARPERSRLRFARRRAGRSAAPALAVPPALVVLAGAEQRDEVPPASPAPADLALLVDVPGRRVLVGPPDLLRSTLIDLLFLAGRFAPHFEKLAERTGAAGERVTTWRIRWPEEAAS
jgi:Oligosaccharyl transferase STT3, N-terminal